MWQDGATFPCYYSQMNPWIVLSQYSEDEEVTTAVMITLLPADCDCAGHQHRLLAADPQPAVPGVAGGAGLLVLPLLPGQVPPLREDRRGRPGVS